MTIETKIDFVPWDEFYKGFQWKQGEHVSLIGPTGMGKTTLGLAILEKRQYVVAIGTKPKDPTLRQLIGQGYKRVANFPEHVSTDLTSKLLVWPKFDGPADMKKQQKAIGQGLINMFAQGGWTIFADELRYLCSTLKLTSLFELIWQQGRSIKISLVGGTQRPAFVPLMLYDQATHLFFWSDNDEVNLKRIGGVGSINSRSIRDIVSRLPKHDALYINTRTNEMMVTRAPKKLGV